MHKECILLNIHTFKRFCIKAGTHKADQIHDYFINLEHIFHTVMKEQDTNLVKMLEEKVKSTESLINYKEQEYQIKLKKQREIEKEKLLLSQFSMYIPVVYIIRVKTFESGEYIVKIGESRRGVVTRYNEHKNKYPECVLLDVFVVQQSKDFESYIHNHPKIRCNQVRDLEGHEQEHELFLIGKNLTYQMILEAVDSQIDNYQEYGTKKIEIELEKLKILANSNASPVTIELLESNKRLEESNKELHNRLNKMESMIEKLLNMRPEKVQTGFKEDIQTIGPRVQKINPDTMQLLKVYESATEVINEDHTIKRSSLSKAVIKNTIYNGYRWQFVDRCIDANILQNIKPTREKIAKTLDYIAKLNADQTEILNVYLDRSTASKMNGYSIGGIDNSVKYGSITRGHYYKLYNECDDKLVLAFEEKYGKDILLYKNGFGVFSEDGELLREYQFKNDCMKSEKVCEKTVAKAIAKNKPYNGLIFKELPARLSCY